MSQPPPAGPPAPGPNEPAPGAYGQPPESSAYGQPPQPPAYGQPPQPPAYGQPPESPAYGQPYPPPQPGDQEPGTDPAAIVGLILAIVAPLVGLIVSLVALGRTGPGKRGGRGLAVAGTIVGALLTLLSLGVFVLFVIGIGQAASELDELDAEIDAAIESAEAELEAGADDALGGADAGGDAAGETADDAAGDAAGAEPPGDLLPLGTAAEIGDYTVTVTGVTLDATDIVAAENQFNDPADGQYVLVDVSATYGGDGQGTFWLDLTGSYAGTDGLVYDETSCNAVTPNSPFDAPDVTAGGTVEVSYCFDVPAEAIDGGSVIFEDTFSLDDADRTAWATS